MLIITGAVVWAWIFSSVLAVVTIAFVCWLDEKEGEGSGKIIIWLIEAAVAILAIWLQRQFLVPMLIQEKGTMAYALVSAVVFFWLVSRGIKIAWDDDSIDYVVYGFPGAVALGYVPVVLLLAAK